MKKFISIIMLCCTFSSFAQNKAPNFVSTSLKGITLQAEIIPDYIELKWRIPALDESASFEVQRSADGFAYSTIHIVTPQGMNTFSQDFSFRDLNPLEGKNYYRLLATGKWTKEKREVYLIAQFDQQKRRITPTIVTEGTQLRIDNYNGEELQLAVFTSAGNPVFQKVINNSRIPVPTMLSKGVYVYHLSDKQRTYVASGRFLIM